MDLGDPPDGAADEKVLLEACHDRLPEGVGRAELLGSLIEDGIELEYGLLGRTIDLAGHDEFETLDGGRGGRGACGCSRVDKMGSNDDFRVESVLIPV